MFCIGRQIAYNTDSMTYVFFDLDQTLIKVQSQRLLLKTLYKKRFIGFKQLWRLRMFFFRYRLHLISHKNLTVVYEYVAQMFKGVDVAKLRKAVRAFVFTEFAAVRNYPAVEELEKHITAGKDIVLCSSAFEPIVEAAALFFHIPEYVCTKLEIKNDTYTGNLDGMPNYGEEKIKKLSKYSFEGSFAYSDHHSDIPMIEKATYRYAVSPTRQMRAYAKSHGWFIIE